MTSLGDFRIGADHGTVRSEHLRLMARIARMYHERGLRQGQIADELHISQPRVSRLLKQAAEIGIVRTVVRLPGGVHTDLEEALESKFGLVEAVVADSDGLSSDPLGALGSAAATYLETTVIGHERVGISSWSASLLSTALTMRPSRTQVAEEVVQLVGGLGNPSVQVQATRLLERLSMNFGASAKFQMTPGVLGTAESRANLLADPTMGPVQQSWDRLTMSLVGIGSLDPSPMLRESGNTLAAEDQQELDRLGAVGDVCLRYFDAHGDHVPSQFDSRVAGIAVRQLMAVPRRIGVAGGAGKHDAVRGAIVGGWVNILITDSVLAQHLLADEGPPAK